MEGGLAWWVGGREVAWLGLAGVACVQAVHKGGGPFFYGGQVGHGVFPRNPNLIRKGTARVCTRSVVSSSRQGASATAKNYSAQRGVTI